MMVQINCHCGPNEPQSPVQCFILNHNHSAIIEKQAYIYFLSNERNNVLYIGVTDDILRRVAEHKAKINTGFTFKYNCDKLIYYETFALPTDAIAREKQLKNWKRAWKNELVNNFNPEWRDLSENIGITNEIIESVKTRRKKNAE